MARKPTAATAGEAQAASPASSHVEYVYPVLRSFLDGNMLYGPPAGASPGVMRPRSQFVCQTTDPNEPNYCRPTQVQYWRNIGCLGDSIGLADPHIVDPGVASGDGFGWAEFSAMIDEDPIQALTNLDDAVSRGLLSADQMIDIQNGLEKSPELRFQTHMLGILGA